MLKSAIWLFNVKFVAHFRSSDIHSYNIFPLSLHYNPYIYNSLKEQRSFFCQSSDIGGALLGERGTAQTTPASPAGWLVGDGIYATAATGHPRRRARSAPREGARASSPPIERERANGRRTRTHGHSHTLPRQARRSSRARSQRLPPLRTPATRSPREPTVTASSSFSPLHIATPCVRQKPATFELCQRATASPEDDVHRNLQGSARRPQLQQVSTPATGTPVGRALRKHRRCADVGPVARARGESPHPGESGGARATRRARGIAQEGVKGVRTVISQLHIPRSLSLLEPRCCYGARARGPDAAGPRSLAPDAHLFSQKARRGKLNACALFRGR